MRRRAILPYGNPHADTPDLGGSNAAEPAPEPAPPPAPAPAIRLPSPDEPFSTNPSNPDGGG